MVKTVGDAFEMLKNLRTKKEITQNILKTNPYHSEFSSHLILVKKINKEIYRLEELVHNQELDDSYEVNGVFI